MISQFWQSGKSGLLKYVTGTDPVAGTEILVTVPAGKIWRLLSFAVNLVTDVSVIDRVASLLVDDGVTVYALLNFTGITQAASLNYHYFYNRLLQEGGGVTANNGLWCATWKIGEIILLPGSRLRTVTSALQPGDDYGAPLLLVEEFEI